MVVMFADPTLSVGTPLLVLISLFCLWAVTSRWHWGWRVATVLVFTMALLPTRASDLIAYVLIHSGLVALCVSIERRLTSKRSGGRAESTAGTTRQNHTWRTLLLLSLACLAAAGITLLPKPRLAFDPSSAISAAALIMAIVALGIAGVLELVRRAHSRRPREHCEQTSTGRWTTLFQFGLADLLLAAACAGALTTIGSKCMAQGFRIPHSYTVASAAVTCGMILFSAWFVYTSCRYWIKAISFVVVGWVAYYAAGLIHQLQTSGLPQVLSASLGLIGLFSFCAVSILILAAARGARSSKPAGNFGSTAMLLRVASRLGLALMLVLLLGLNLRLYVYMWRPLVPLKPQFPVPNAYDELLQIGNKLSGGPQSGNLTGAEQQSLLLQAREAMTRPCQVPLRYDISTNDSEYADSQYTLYRLSRSFELESIASTMTADYGLATDYALDCVQLGQSSAGGGTYFAWSYANEFEQRGIEQLRQLRRWLDPKQCSRILLRLHEIERERESFNLVLDRTARWDRHVLDWDDWLMNYDMLRWHGPSTILSPLRYDSSWYGGRASEKWRDAMMRLLQVELALQAFRIDTGQDPMALAQLVPTYLSSVPLDPYDNGPIRYRRTDGGYDCYSIGPDNKDDGGERVPQSEVQFKGDLFLDTADFIDE